MSIERRKTVEEDFQNFLVYTGYGRFCQVGEISRLRIAYLHGNNRGRDEASSICADSNPGLLWPGDPRNVTARSSKSSDQG